MVRALGVATSASAIAGAARGVAGGTAAAISRFAAYRSPSEKAMASSPESASTWNSSEPLPPMAPGSATTERNFSPRRVKMAVYALCMAS